MLYEAIKPVNIRAKPNLKAKWLGRWNVGDIVEVDEIIDNWLEIIKEDNTRVFSYAPYFEKVEIPPMPKKYLYQIEITELFEFKYIITESVEQIEENYNDILFISFLGEISDTESNKVYKTELDGIVNYHIANSFSEVMSNYKIFHPELIEYIGEVERIE